jgi:glycosyltransferase involved in cell wall biosynthesis
VTHSYNPPSKHAEEIADTVLFVKEPLVSVLMLTFNHAAYIRKAIESVLAQQTTFHFEVIIGVDNSSDETCEIACSFQRKAPHLVRVIAWKENVGMHRNLGALIAEAKGEFIAFCEGDDYWLGSSKLQEQVDFIQCRPECGLAHGNYVNLVKIGGSWRARVAFRSPRQLRDRSGAIYPAMLGANRIQTCTVVCRRSMVLDYRRRGPGVDNYLVGDWPLFLYLAHESGIGFIDRPLAVYRRTPGSVTNSGHHAAVARGMDAIRMVEDFCAFFNDKEQVKRCGLSLQYTALLHLAFRASDDRSFRVAWDWLAANAPARLRGIQVQLMRFFILRPRLLEVAHRGLARWTGIKNRMVFKTIREPDVRQGWP